MYTSLVLRIKGLNSVYSLTPQKRSKMLLYSRLIWQIIIAFDFFYGDYHTVIRKYSEFLIMTAIVSVNQYWSPDHAKTKGWLDISLLFAYTA